MIGINCAYNKSQGECSQLLFTKSEKVLAFIGVCGIIEMYNNLNAIGEDMKITEIAKIESGSQDGAIWSGYLFRMGSRGRVRVYDMARLSGEVRAIAEFYLDRHEELVPHSNAVMFGNEYYAEGDEFPLLYSNIYNNLKNEENKEVGVTCVYRLTREGEVFSPELVQLIEVDFTAEAGLWRSEEGVEDVRPYGNFVIDREKSMIWGFVMRDGDKNTRYFSWRLPTLAEGEPDKKYGVRRATLKKDNIIEYFDTPYHFFIQGATFDGGKVYSTEGFGAKIHPALRLIDTNEKKEVFHVDLYPLGLVGEAEFIDIYEGVCYYGDAEGHIYRFDF